MILTTQKHFVFPLSEKIKIAGMHVETGRSFKQEVVSGKLRLTDTWNIQIIFTPTSAPAQAELSLLEFPVLWEDEFPWKEDYPNDHLTFSYKKTPRNLSAHIWEEGRTILLDLMLEAALEVEFGWDANSLPPPAPDPSDLNAALHRVEALEERIRVLSEAFSNLESEVEILKEKLPPKQVLKGRLAGTILDEFRMAPIPKSILEFFLDGSREACAKIASDNQGYFSCGELAPGNYEIKIKHPRFLPLIITDFTIREGENKYQDFILRRS